MWQHSERLKDMTPQGSQEYRDILTLRSQSLLASSNALSQVDPSNAWFITIASTRLIEKDRVGGFFV